MGLTSYTPPETKCAASPNEIDMRRAGQLHNAVVKAGKCRRWSLCYWAKEFAKLFSELGFNVVPEDSMDEAPCRDMIDFRIDAALNWYCDHISDQYAPQAWSAKAFRLKFDAIEAAMKRWQAKNPTVTVSKDAESIAKDLHRLNWPGRTAEELPVAIQLSLDNYLKFYLKIKGFDMSKHSVLGGFAKTLLARLSYPSNFVAHWFNTEVSWITKAKDFNGSLVPTFVLRIDHEKFQAIGKRESTRYSGDTKLWTRLMKEIGQ